MRKYHLRARAADRKTRAGGGAHYVTIYAVVNRLSLTAALQRGWCIQMRRCQTRTGTADTFKRLSVLTPGDRPGRRRTCVPSSRRHFSWRALTRWTYLAGCGLRCGRRRGQQQRPEDTLHGRMSSESHRSLYGLHGLSWIPGSSGVLIAAGTERDSAPSGPYRPDHYKYARCHQTCGIRIMIPSPVAVHSR